MGVTRTRSFDGLGREIFCQLKDFHQPHEFIDHIGQTGHIGHIGLNQRDRLNWSTPFEIAPLGASKSILIHDPFNPKVLLPIGSP